MFKILISSADTSRDDLSKVLIKGDKFVSVLLKTNGEHVWLVSREDDLSLIEEEKIRDVMTKTKIHLKTGFSDEDLSDARTLLVVSEDVPTITTQPTILDIPLGKENLETAISKTHHI